MTRIAIGLTVGYLLSCHALLIADSNQEKAESKQEESVLEKDSKQDSKKDSKQDSKTTTVTIFLRYKLDKAKVDDEGKPIPVPIRANGRIRLDEMTVNGAKVKIQKSTVSKGQVVKIDDKDYQVKKYLNQGSSNKMGAPAVVIEKLPPAKYTLAVKLTADFEGLVDQQSSGTATFEVKKDEEFEPALEQNLFCKHGK